MIPIFTSSDYQTIAMKNTHTPNIISTDICRNAVTVPIYSGNTKLTIQHFTELLWITFYKFDNNANKSYY